MARLSQRLLLAALLFCAAYLAVRANALPDSVAYQFNAAGHAAAWMSRAAYLSLMFGCGVVLPASIAAAVAWAAQRAGRRFSTAASYWFAPERRPATLDFAIAYGAWLGIVVAGYVAGVHRGILAANQLDPPHLVMTGFWLQTLTFSVGLIVLVAAPLLRFRRRA
jgi:hypothetical protein